MKKNIYNKMWLLPFMALLLFGCTDDHLPDNTDIVDNGNEVEVTFQFTVPAFTTITTRAMTSRETTVDKVDVLVYEVDEAGKERFVYHRGMMADGVQMSGSSGTFKVRLAKSKAGEKYTFDFCFNATNLSSNVYNNTIKVGDTRQQVQQAYIATGFGISSSTTNLPMWAGITAGIEITAATSFPTLRVFHSLARVDVGLNLNQQDVSQGLSNFTMTNIYAPLAANRSCPIPDVANLNAAGDKFLAPSLSDSYTMGSTESNGSKTVMGDAVIADYYLYEPDVNRVNNGRTFAIVVRGNYTATGADGSTTTTPYYYPIRFSDPEDPAQRLPIIRNNLYRINILGIHGPGYTSALLAAAGGEINITYDLHVEEGGDINHVVYNNHNYLGVSTTYQEHEGMATSGQIKARTNVSGGWKVSATDEDGNSVSNWFSYTTTYANFTTRVGTLDYTLEAHSSAPRTAVLTFTAGPLSIQTRILQNGSWHIYSDYQTGTMMRGDGDSYNVSVWGNVPSNLQVRAWGPERNQVISYGTLTYTGGVVQEASPQTQPLEITGNAWLPMKIRDVQFQYSIDNGATWVTFQEGPQGKGHFRLRSSGRIVSLYDYTPGTGYTWSEAMGIDPAWDYVGANQFYYRDISLPYTFPWTVQINGYALASGNNRNGLYYVPDRMTGCADYEEKGYETEYPKGRWRLPAVQEVLEMYQYRDHIGDIAIQGEKYWTSTDQNVTGAEYGGSFYIYINNPTTGLESQPTGSSTRRWDLYHVRCVYDDPDTDVILDQYHGWLYNPNRTFEDVE